MIGRDPLKATALRAELSDRFAPDDEPLADKARVLLETVTDPAFPGLLCPTGAPGEDMIVVVGADGFAGWERLAALLTAAIGPSFSDFTGVPVPLPDGHAIVEILAQAGCTITGTLTLPPDEAMALRAITALDRLRHMLADAPPMIGDRTEPTPLMLTRFDDALAVKDRPGAQGLLERLRADLRLDGINLSVLKLCLRAAFGEWQAALDDEPFEDLADAYPNSALSELLLEVLYRGRYSTLNLEDVIDPEDAARIGRLVSGLDPATMAAPAVRMAGLHALSEGASPARFAALTARKDDLGDLRAAIEAQVLEEPEAVPSERAPTPDITNVEKPPPVRADWLGWLSQVGEATFKNAVGDARIGAETWSIGDAEGDPVNVAVLVNALEAAWNSPIAEERIAAALPSFVHWLIRDEHFPRASMRPLYASVLMLFEMGARQRGQTFDAARAMVGALLEFDLDRDSYGRLAATADALAGGSPGLDGIFRLLASAEDFLFFPAPDGEAREAYLHGVMGRIAPFYPRMTPLQRHATEQLARDLGVTLPEIDAGHAEKEKVSFAAAMAGKRIAIYSLSEGASRAAAATLHKLAPDAVVECDASHGGNESLRALAQNADLFVIAWSSATHAATDFIRANLKDALLLYAAGKGMSSILRAVEEYAAQTA